MTEQIQTTLESHPVANPQVKIDFSLYQELKKLGIIRDHTKEDVRGFNIGESDYSKHLIQPWTIWQSYNLDPWDADIIKRVLRTKQGESRVKDYEKIIHVCKEKIRQINENRDNQSNIMD